MADYTYGFAAPGKASAPGYAGMWGRLPAQDGIRPGRLQDLAPPPLTEAEGEPQRGLASLVPGAYQESRVMPVPQSIGRTALDIAVRNILNGNAEKLAKETLRSAGELRDSANALMYKATNPSEKLINESITNRLRKFGK